MSQEDAMLERALSWIGPTKKLGQDRAEVDVTRETTGGEPGDGIGPVCVGVVEGPLRAEIARTYLEQAGIAVYLQGEALGTVYGFTSGPLGTVRVLVPAAQAEEATQIFSELDFSDEGNNT
jgi:Putative prokaryotic signal transducing protein